MLHDVTSCAIFFSVSLCLVVLIFPFFCFIASVFSFCLVFRRVCCLLLILCSNIMLSEVRSLLLQQRTARKKESRKIPGIRINRILLDVFCIGVNWIDGFNWKIPYLSSGRQNTTAEHLQNNKSLDCWSATTTSGHEIRESSDSRDSAVNLMNDGEVVQLCKLHTFVQPWVFEA